MITLTIRKKDGSIYWVEHFNTRKDADDWIKEEKTRPYWDKTYTIQIDEPPIDETPKPDMATIKQLKKMALKNAKTIAELKTWIQDNLL